MSKQCPWTMTIESKSRKKREEKPSLECYFEASIVILLFSGKPFIHLWSQICVWTSNNLFIGGVFLFHFLFLRENQYISKFRKCYKISMPCFHPWLIVLSLLSPEQNTVFSCLIKLLHLVFVHLIRRAHAITEFWYIGLF